MSASPEVRWTPVKDARLIELRRAGMSYGRIGQMMRVSKNAVVGRADKLDLCAPSPIKRRPGGAAALLPIERAEVKHQGRPDANPLPAWHPIIVEVFLQHGLPVP